MNDTSRQPMFVTPDDPEWTVMWEALRSLDPDGDTRAENPDNGEVWQYMGTWNPDGGPVHTFRHRDHPRTGAREYINVPCSAEYLSRNTVAPEQDEPCPF